MTRKQRKKVVRRERRAENRYTKLLFNLLCEGIADGDERAERIMDSWQPEGHRIAGQVRYMTRGPAGLITEGAAR